MIWFNSAVLISFTIVASKRSIYRSKYITGITAQFPFGRIQRAPTYRLDQPLQRHTNAFTERSSDDDIKEKLHD